MKSKIIKLLAVFILVALSVSLVYAWGSWGHKHITRSALFALPDGMKTFYYNHIDFMTESSVMPDVRKYALNDRVEGPRHYVDIEDFGASALPLPKTTGEAYTKYESAFLNKTGYLPWYIQNMTSKLTDAFKKRNKSEILFLSAELSHYLADANMPLHTSSNHDGQKTGQKGVHALWESMLPQQFGKNYNFKVEKAVYLPSITDATWDIINRSHSLVDTLLAIEKSVRVQFNEDNMYKKDAEGKRVLFFNSPVFSDAYATAFHTSLNGMVEKQLRHSIQDVANFWFTAWVNAGSPDILSLDDPHLTKQNRKNFKAESKAWEKGKILNLSVDRED